MIDNEFGPHIDALLKGTNESMINTVEIEKEVAADHHAMTLAKRALAIVAAASTSPPVDIAKHRRADWAYNPSDVFMCPNGHLQYNLTEEEQNEMRAKGEKPLPICYEGELCRHCTETLEQLTTDPKELQYKLSIRIMNETKLKLQIEPLLVINKAMNEISLFIRNRYQYEMETGKPQHQGNDPAKAVLYYMGIERRRVSVRMGQLWRAMLRGLGVR